MFVITLFSSCYFGGDNRLGRFSLYTFPVSKHTLESTIDSLFKQYPEYKEVPKKWKMDTNSKGLLESWTFYFKTEPEEMYGVTLIGDSAMLADKYSISIAIRTVYDGNHWKAVDAFDSKERNRIDDRFKTDIVSKLEKITRSKAKAQD